LVQRPGHRATQLLSAVRCIARSGMIAGSYAGRLHEALSTY
jgi:hypothetical protein